MISGATFPDGSSLGLFLTKEDGSSAYDTPYDNIQYTSSTSSSNQIWTASSPILLTGTKANVYAYYPYDANYNDITAIPIDVTENKDVMWAMPYSGAYNASPTATLPMNHALSVIRLSLSNGDYSGAGSIESIKIQGDCMAKTGTLNAKTGDLTAADGGTEIDFGITAENPVTLTASAQTMEQLVIPTTTGSPIKVTIQMDGKTFDATSTASFTPEKSKAYKFGLTFMDSKLSMSEVSIGTIAEVAGEDMTPIVDTGSAWSKFTTENDGVYGIDADGKPLTYDEASAATSLSGVAIVMYGRALQISNTQPSSTIYWGSTSVNISGIPDLTVVGGGSSEEYGYLAGSNTPQLNKDYTTWLNTDNTALADTAGWSHTEALITAQGSSYIGGATTTFRNSSSNSTWFVPAAGQLAYIYLNVTNINTLLHKVTGATQISTSSVYWSSSECSAGVARHVDFGHGCVDFRAKNNYYYMRFCRDITE